VGSEEAFTLWDAAQQVAALSDPPVAVERGPARDPVSPPSRHVPSVALAREELGLDVWVPLDEALRRTWDWLRPVTP
jgi:dTDP-glucose 4,6-dehydratase